MNDRLTLEAAEYPGLRLRAAQERDLEFLRTWKNANAKSFFFQGELSPSDQTRWFEGYRLRADDFMFLAEADGVPVGCIGVRRLPEDLLDVYNVIRGVPGAGGPGVMGRALRLACAFAARRHPGLPIGLTVLKRNPAVHWYEKNGLEIVGEDERSFSMRLRGAPATLQIRESGA